MTKRKMIAIITILVISCFLVSSCSIKSTETTTLQESIPYSTPSARESVLESPTQEWESPFVSFKPSVSQEPTPSPLSSTETETSESVSHRHERDHTEWYIEEMDYMMRVLLDDYDSRKCSGEGLSTSGLVSDPLTGTGLYIDTSSIGRIDQSSEGPVLSLPWILGTENFDVVEAVEKNYEFVLCYGRSGDEYLKVSVVSLVRAGWGGFCGIRMDGTTVLKDLCAMQNPDEETTVFYMCLLVIDKDFHFNDTLFYIPNPEEGGDLWLAKGRFICWDEGYIYCSNAAFEVMNSWT